MFLKSWTISVLLIEVLREILNIVKKINNCHSELFKYQRCSELIFSETALFERWFLAPHISVSSAVQRFSGNEQHWNRPESILNQSWSALNVSETSARDKFCRLREEELEQKGFESIKFLHDDFNWILRRNLSKFLVSVIQTSWRKKSKAWF